MLVDSGGHNTEYLSPPLAVRCQFTQLCRHGFFFPQPSVLSLEVSEESWGWGEVGGRTGK